MTPAPLPGLYSVGAAMAATGRALDWYRTEILGGTVTTDTLLREVADTPAGADGLVFLPYLPANVRRSGIPRRGACSPA